MGNMEASETSHKPTDLLISKIEPRHKSVTDDLKKVETYYSTSTQPGDFA